MTPTPERLTLYAFRIPAVLLARIRARVQRDSQYASVSHFIRRAIERALQQDP